MSLNKWASCILGLLLIVGFSLCLRRFEYFSMSEIKALISVLFGFATSCLLLSFMWLLQNKPIQEPWQRADSLTIDMPSMNPRGRANSTLVARNFHNRDQQHQQGQQQQISTISGQQDLPPNYNDALINSKPLSWYYLPIEKPLDETASQTAASGAEVASQEKPMGPKMGGVAQLAMNMMRRPRNHHLSPRELEASQPKGPTEWTALDVSQLPVCGSPPKYSELNFTDLPTMSGQFQRDSSRHSSNSSGNGLRRNSSGEA